MLLDVIEKNHTITQRDMSSFINASVSMINEYLMKFERMKYINRVYHSKKRVNYHITKKGVNRRKLLNIWFLSESQSIYFNARNNLASFIRDFIKADSKLIIYGAGEVCEIFVDMIESSNLNHVRIVGIIDDNTNKQGNDLRGFRISSPDVLNGDLFDHIFIASYNHREQIMDKLSKNNIAKDKIIDFFGDTSNE